MAACCCLQVMAAAGVASRRACEDLIEKGEVSVNGKVVQTQVRHPYDGHLGEVRGGSQGAAPLLHAADWSPLLHASRRTPRSHMHPLCSTNFSQGTVMGTVID